MMEIIYKQMGKYTTDIQAHEQQPNEREKKLFAFQPNQYLYFVP